VRIILRPRKHVNPLKHQFLLNNVYKFNSHLTGNTSSLPGDQLIEAWQGNICCIPEDLIVTCIARHRRDKRLA
jgi:hypothetical protein